MIEDEFRKLISEIKAYRGVFPATNDFIDDYNDLIKRAKEIYPDNRVIRSKVEFNLIIPTIDNHAAVEKNITSECNDIIESFSLERDSPKQPQVTYNLNIGFMNGDFSFQSIHNQIQNSDIGNKIQINNYVDEFKKELEKKEPDRTKLKKTLVDVKAISSDIFAGLAVEFIKRFLGV